jgi:monofunctional biosynthetic peptidoglycan transglycosylase
LPQARRSVKALTAMETQPEKPSRIRRVLRWAAWTLASISGVLVVLMALWAFRPPVSTLMAARYLTGRPVERVWMPLANMPQVLVVSVIASEDGQFCRHHGVDWGALRGVIRDAGEDGPARGASTLAMQTAKNLFLWPSRSSIRKGLEIPLAMAITRLWGRQRVLEVYLNVAEWGDGVFGVEAAAKRYFGKSVAALTPREAALLVSALPNPFVRNPARPSIRQNRVVNVIMRRAAREGEWRECLR